VRREPHAQFYERPAASAGLLTHRGSRCTNRERRCKARFGHSLAALALNTSASLRSIKTSALSARLHHGAPPRYRSLVFLVIAREVIVVLRSRDVPLLQRAACWIEVPDDDAVVIKAPASRPLAGRCR
jgi:hypothetical protein